MCGSTPHRLLRSKHLFCKTQSDVHFENAREDRKPRSVPVPRPPACSASSRLRNQGSCPFTEVVILPQGLSWVLCAEPRGLQQGGGAAPSPSPLLPPLGGQGASEAASSPRSTRGHFRCLCLVSVRTAGLTQGTGFNGWPSAWMNLSPPPSDTEQCPGTLVVAALGRSGMLLSIPQCPGRPLPLPAETYPAPDVSGAVVVAVPALGFPVIGVGVGTQAQACRDETDPEEPPPPALRPGG